MTMKRNNTEMAPTYTISMSKAKNSKPKNKEKQEERKKIKIRFNIECTGLLDKIVEIPAKKISKKKKKN